MDDALKAVLVTLQPPGLSDYTAQSHLGELTGLVNTLGIVESRGLVVKHREPHPRLLVGSGKAEEIVAAALDFGATLVIFDDDLSPSQQRNWEELSGLTVRDEECPEGDIEIAVTGLRPGEKLHEELLIGDNPESTAHPRIMKAHEDFIPWTEFEARLNALEIALNVNDAGVISLMMRQMVAGYAPSHDIVDWVYLERETESMAVAATTL
jgi:hypothetical protein